MLPIGHNHRTGSICMVTLEKWHEWAHPHSHVKMITRRNNTWKLEGMGIVARVTLGAVDQALLQDGVCPHSHARIVT